MSEAVIPEPEAPFISIRERPRRLAVAFALGFALGAGAMWLLVLILALIGRAVV